jgi:protein TonB
MNHRFVPLLLFSWLILCGCPKKSEPITDPQVESVEETVTAGPGTVAEGSEIPVVPAAPEPVGEVPGNEAAPEEVAATIRPPGEFGAQDDTQKTPPDVNVGEEIVVQSPEPLVYFTPFYPLSKRMEGIEGKVVLKFVIDRSGRIVNPTVSASTAPEFNEYALQAVRDWRFLPAISEGKPISLEVTSPVTFASEKGTLGAEPGSIFSILDLIFDTYYISGLNGYELAEFEVTPIYQQAPRRPVDDEGNLIYGSVLVSFAVSTEGQVEDAKVIESTATELEMPALTAIKYWQFLPRIREGKPVRGRVNQTIKFTAEEKAATP